MSVTRIRKHSAIGRVPVAGRRGQTTTVFAVSADVTYPGQPTETVTFIGEQGGRVVTLLAPSGLRQTVADPFRFGRFGTDWVQRYYGVAA